MSQDKRLAARIDCDIPVRLRTETDEVVALMLDASRTGLRLRVAGHLLGVHRLSSLVQVARGIEQVLGDRFQAELHYEMLGPLIRKNLRPVRIGRRDWETADVEIGCVLEAPLRDEEAGMLGLALPREGASEPPENLKGLGPTVRAMPKSPARPRVKAPSEPVEVAAEPSAVPVHEIPLPPVSLVPGPDDDVTMRRGRGHGNRVWVYPAEGHTGRPMVGLTESISQKELVVMIPSAQELGLTGRSVAAVAMALGNAYGQSVSVKVADGARHLWTGPVKIRELELAPEPAGHLRLGLTFERTLRPAELTALGLA
jgi:hypothetical protein